MAGQPLGCAAESCELPDIVCAGLACVDMELLSCDNPATREAITKYSSVRYTPGGSAPQTSRALSALSMRVAAVYPAGDDAHGRELQAMLRRAGVQAHPVATSAPTALAVLPVYHDGARGCFVSLGANDVITAEALLNSSVVHSRLRAFHFGYPHLMPQVQGENLSDLLTGVRAIAPGVVISVDVNGASKSEVLCETSAEGRTPSSERGSDVLVPALGLVDLLHTNLEEACVISGLADPASVSSLQSSDVESIVEWFCVKALRASTSLRPSSCITVCVTCGKDGVFIGRSGPDCKFLVTHRKSYAVLAAGKLNTSGAGDSFAAGSLTGLLSSGTDLKSWDMDALIQVADCGLASALKSIEQGSQSVARPPTTTNQHLATASCASLKDLMHAISDRRHASSRFRSEL